MPLKEFAPNQIWVKEVPFRYLGVEVGLRMTVIKLSSGGLFLHSPVQLTDELKKEIDQVGRVSCIISPNNLHHLYIGEYFEQYPLADIYASPGLPEKRTDLSFRLSLKHTPPELWQSDLDQTMFMGHDSLREVVFFHRKSKTLVLADLIMFFDESFPPLTRFVTKLFGMYNHPVPPIDFDVSSIQTMQAKLSVERILQWDFDKIIISHGCLILKNAKDTFQEAFSWLYESNQKT